MYKILISLLGLSLLLFAEVPTNGGEFPLIQPVSVENAPVALEIKPEPKQKPEPKPVKKVKKETKQEIDSDNDGVVDSKDKCPNTPLGVEVDAYGCPLDSDGDGVPDYMDKCPDTSKMFKVDGYGCPQTATLKINFPPNAHKVTNNLLKEVEEFAKFLKDNIGYQVVVIGYTDSQGKAAANKELSRKRANSVKEALMRYGIKGTRLTAVGRGIENPIATNKTANGRAENRRIEIELIQ